MLIAFSSPMISPVTVSNAEIDDFVLLRSDGTPTYMLAVVVGGAGTMAVAFFWSRWFPELRTARRLDGRG